MIKNIKHIEGHFTLFHDITNTLRYGDFSFINLKTLKVEKIGELKTKKVDSQTLDLSLTFFKRKFLLKDMMAYGTGIETMSLYGFT